MIVARGSDDGSVTLEVALVSPVVAVLVAVVLGLTAVVADQLAAERAARTMARAAAVTGHVGTVDGLPPGTTVRRTYGSGTVTVAVTVRGDVAGVPYTVAATAVSPLEPAVR